MSAVNQAIADWMAAQRRCANSITALYGGTHYTADNADGNQTAGEYGYTADQLTAAAGSDEGLPWGKTEDTATRSPTSGTSSSTSAASSPASASSPTEPTPPGTPPKATTPTPDSQQPQ